MLIYGLQSYCHIFVDACLEGAGAKFNTQVYAEKFPSLGQHKLGIVELEMLNVIVAIRVWARKCRNRNVIIHSDNFAVVHILNYYKTKNLYLGACMRNLWMVVARHNITLSAIHIPGKCNVIADILSRWYLDTGKNKEVRNYI